MVTAMKDLSEKYPEIDFVYPMHLNPNVRKPIHEVFGEELTRSNFFFHRTATVSRVCISHEQSCYCSH